MVTRYCDKCKTKPASGLFLFARPIHRQISPTKSARRIKAFGICLDDDGFISSSILLVKNAYAFNSVDSFSRRITLVVMQRTVGAALLKALAVSATPRG
jgi:hypothetical protein